jgi:MerR family transcriptional regulator, aldehyde-responsive regulator
MNISEAARASGLSVDSIRFYEKSGMLPHIARGKRGWRDFSADALNWLINLERLRATGMPLKEMKRFAILIHTKESAAVRKQRLEILETHQARLKERRKTLADCEAYLTHKISVYSKKG